MKSTLSSRAKINKMMSQYGATNEKFFVSTTNKIEGHVISSHMGIVSGHVVLGVNIISDFFASVSDVVGGRSKTYEDQLISSYNQVITNLQNKAKEKGGNALIGLKIDHDHISGQGKSMFMVNAIATAVKVDTDEVNESKSYDINLSTKEIPSQLLGQISHHMDMIKLISENPDELRMEKLTLDNLIFFS